MRMRLRTAAVLLFVLILPSCAEAPRQPAEGDLVIFHTNDIHGGFLPSATEGKEGAPPAMVGGFAALDTWLRAHRKEAANSLLLDAGDVMTGNPLCEIEDDGVKGTDLVKMFNLAGYDGFTIGNHDFDDGLENLQKLEGKFKFPVLCANVTLADGTPLAKEGYHIYDVGPLRVGVIGLLMGDLDKVVPAATMAKIKVEAPIDAVKRLLPKIDPDTDVIILLTHEGLDEDRALARQLGPEVDVIVGGHSHTSLSHGTVENGIVIVQAGCSLDSIGRLALHVKDDKVVSHEGEMIQLKADQVAPGPEMKTLLDKDEARVQALFGETIGTLETEWKRNYYGESNLGNFVADALREKWNADFACINSGSLRKNMAPGPITRLDVYEVYPFTNPIVTFEVTGDELMKILQHNAWSAVNHDHGVLQLSGVTYEYARDGGKDAKIVKATVGGQPIDPKKTYKGVSGNFIVVDKAEKYLGFAPVRTWADTGCHVRAIVEEAIRARKTVKSAVEGRIVGPER